jgi:hypothetical protein
MLFNDKETQDFERRFQESLVKVRKFMTTEKEMLDEKISIIIDELPKLIDKPNKTAEDLIYIDNVERQLKALMSELDEMKSVLEESLTRQSAFFYQHIKRLAKEGCNDAAKIYADLKPSYEAMLRGQMGNN